MRSIYEESRVEVMVNGAGERRRVRKAADPAPRMSGLDDKPRAICGQGETRKKP